MRYENDNIENIQNMYGESAYGSSAFGSGALEAPPVCPTGLKYSGDTITLKATPKDGVGPYDVTFQKDGVTIDPSRLGGLSNPILGAPEDVEITRIYTLNDADIVGALGGTIEFSVYVEDSCPSPIGPKTCSGTCIINIGCLAPVCNFFVT